MAHDQETYRRGTAASVFGFFVQLLLAIVMMLAAFWIENTGWGVGTVTVYAMTWHLFAGLASLLLSLLAQQLDPIINTDGVLYIETAGIFLERGFAAASDSYFWPYMSILIAGLH